MQPKKILVIQNKRIGDVLIASVLANNLKSHFENCHITYFVYDYTAGVIEQNPNIDRIILAKDAELKRIPILLNTIRQLRKEKYDIIIDPYAKFQSRLMCLLSGTPVRIGFKRKGKRLKLPFYTQAITFLDQSSLPCGKALQDRMNLLEKAFGMQKPDPMYGIFLTEEEKKYQRIASLDRPVIMLGVLGSTPNKSLPYEYTAKLIDYLAKSHKATLLFNYAPHQKEEALRIYDMCQFKEQINLDIYEDSIRGFVKLMNQCDLLISNEGGSVHIAKALDKPTFTIYSPYINKSHWNSFEDGKKHDSIHLFEDDEDYFESLSREEKKEIEANPEQLYRKLTPALILDKLMPYLSNHL
ncbi:MAG: glycosyltransferase family 9 protein [Flavobacteriaceae bacterium]|nr:glycosyltransferase family 9 protein [Flavobacteriaceae bacterium]